MRILFDNSTPNPLRRFLSTHTVRTAEELKWERLENGDLLSAGEAAGFDLMITSDQNLEYQQNLATREIALIVLGSNRWPLVQKHVPEIVAAVDAARTNSYAFIEVPLPPKPAYKRSEEQPAAEEKRPTFEELFHSKDDEPDIDR